MIVLTGFISLACRVRLRISRSSLFLVVGLMGLHACMFAWGERMEMDLSGTWEFQQVGALSYPPADSWQTTNVPGDVHGWDNEKAWFRTTFFLESSFSGPCIKLMFGGVKFDSQVWLNGTNVGGYFNGYEPFELDVSTVALPGQTNELIVGVSDWTATFAEPVDFPEANGDQTPPAGFVTNNLLAPVGGHYYHYGIWDSVKIQSKSAVYVADVTVTPSIRNDELAVRVTVQNEGTSSRSIMVSNQVFDGESPVDSIYATTQIVVAAGSETNIDWIIAWDDAHTWTHEDPYLYTMKTMLINAGSTVDEISTRFGFREFWCEGEQFYLNGIPINLLATSCWPPSSISQVYPDEAGMRKVLQDVKAGHCKAFRLHTQPWREKWYTLADEEGMLIIEESAVFCNSYNYRVKDPVFWTNYHQHLEGMIKRDKNHPSVVMWSLENELVHCGAYHAYTGTLDRLADAGRYVKSLDPSRPIMFEADIDPGGVADVINIHYPHEYPDYQDWPNTAYWMDKPLSKSWVEGGEWTWDRSKPLYIGEFLYIPPTSLEDFTIYFGDEAYTDRSAYRNTAKALSWRMQIEAYRAYGVDGICPWNIFEDCHSDSKVFGLFTNVNELYQSQKNAFHPNAVFLDEYGTRFFAGVVTQRHAHIYNDRLTEGVFQLYWKVGDEVWQSSTAFTIQPADQHQETLEFTVPSSTGEFDLHYELREGTTVVYSNYVTCSAYTNAPLSLPSTVKLGLYDPQGDMAGLLDAAGILYTAVSDMYTIDFESFDILVIGPDALAGTVHTMATTWQEFMFGGGWIVVLEQSTYPSWMPFGLQVTNQCATYVFPQTDNPVTSDLKNEDLRWWSDNHYVVDNPIHMPTEGNFRSMASVGSTIGMEYSAALERMVGLGGMICSQWLLTEKYESEPMAGVLLQRLFDYCLTTDNHQVSVATGVLTDNTSAEADVFNALGLVAEDLQGRLAGADLSSHELIIIAGDTAIWQEAGEYIGELTEFVDAGGTLYLHHPSPDFVTAAQSTMLSCIYQRDGAVSHVLKRAGSRSTIQIQNNDLYWLDQPGTWSELEVLSTNIANRYHQRRFDLSEYDTISVDEMELYGGVIPEGDGCIFLSTGYAETTVHVEQVGTYLFGLHAKGWSAAGVWPHSSLKIDGIVCDNTYIASSNIHFYTLMCTMTTGTHTVAITFDNDYYAEPEDRNFLLAELHWGFDTNVTMIPVLSPSALTEITYGNGRVVLDEINWEQEASSLEKAERYISRLLTDIGAELAHDELHIEAEGMTNVVGSLNIDGGLANLYGNARLEQTVFFSETNTYTFCIEAKGSFLDGVGPLLTLSINGSVQQQFYVTNQYSEGMATYSFNNYIHSGIHTVAVAFINDAFDPPEDRNAHIDKITIYPVSTAYDNWIRTLYSPEALLSVAVTDQFADPDGDGADNWAEFLADTDPRNAESSLQIVALQLQGNGAVVDWKGGRDANQILQVCTNLQMGGWVTVFTNHYPTPMESTFLHSDNSVSSAYYRIRAWRDE